MNVNTPEEIGALVREAFAEEKGTFRPCAFFDRRLDCIRVIARDCSVLEERINDRLTVLQDNYFPDSGRKRYVGFTIKGARHFCNQQGWDLAKPIEMSDIIDALLRTFPGPVVEWFVDLVARPLVKEEKIERVEIPATGLQPATS